MEWLRWYHGAVSDSKWPVIARKSGASVGTVVAVWAALLEHASQDEERGSISGFDPETFDVLFGFADGTCAAVVAAMEDKKLLAAGCIASWEKRQVKDEGAAERKRLQREREKLERERTELHTQRAQPEQIRTEQTQTAQPQTAQPRAEPKQADRACVTAGHAGSRAVTPGHTDQNREEKNIHTPPSPPLGGREVGGVMSGSDSDAPGSETPGSKTSGAQTPGSEASGPAAPGPETPGSKTLGPEASDSEMSGPEASGLGEDALVAMSIEFHEFVAAYPYAHREPVAEAAQVWRKLAREKRLPGLPRLFDGVSAWEASEQWQKDGGAFIPKAANFLRKAMWLGAPPPAAKSGAAEPDISAAWDRLKQLEKSNTVVRLPS